MTDHPTLPRYLRRSDGTLMPFDPEGIARDLFAFGRDEGLVDVFLARELTDGIVHFLALDHPSDPFPVAELQELIVKVVRELGHPALAEMYDQHGDLESSLAYLDPEVLQERFPADLLAAHADGLIELPAEHLPTSLAGIRVGPHGRPETGLPSIAEAIAHAATLADHYLAIDGAEDVFLEGSGDLSLDVRAYLQELQTALRQHGRIGVLNLNIAEAPGWAAPVLPGPLFPDPAQNRDPQRKIRVSLALLECAAELGWTGPTANAPCARSPDHVFWHLSEADWTEERLPAVRAVIERVLDGEEIEFVFDRPRRPVYLGPGIDRDQPAALVVIGVNIRLLVRQLGGGPLTPSLFLPKLGSLARIARSAGHACLAALRRKGNPALRERFLLDRAILVIEARELGAAVRAVLGADAGDSNRVADLARDFLAWMRQAVETHAPGNLESVVDSHLDRLWIRDKHLPGDSDRSCSEIGLSDVHLLPRQQVRYASRLQEAAGGGRVDVVLTGNPPVTLESCLELLQTAWRGQVVRLRLVPRSLTPRLLGLE